MLMNTNSAKLSIVLGNFDFVKTQALMEELGWVWGLGETEKVPCVPDMVDVAHSILVKACSGNGNCACGGFEATFQNGVFTLKFVTEKSSNTEAFVYAPIEIVKAADSYATMVQNITISDDFKREPLTELGRKRPIKLDSWEITTTNHANALHAINDVRNFPVEITADIKIEQEGTIHGKELNALDGCDVHELMQKKFEEHGTAYMSEDALADIYAWTAMQAPRKTQKEWFDTPLDEGYLPC